MKRPRCPNCGRADGVSTDRLGLLPQGKYCSNCGKLWAADSPSEKERIEQAITDAARLLASVSRLAACPPELRDALEILRQLQHLRSEREP